MKTVGAGYAKRAAATERRKQGGGELMEKFSQQAYDSLKKDRDNVERLLLELVNQCGSNGWEVTEPDDDAHANAVDYLRCAGKYPWPDPS